MGNVLKRFWALIILLSISTHALAGSKEQALGLSVNGFLPAAGSVGVTVDLGATDVFSVRPDLLLFFAQNGPQLTADLNFVAALDVWTWVPELVIGAGLVSGSTLRPRLQAALGVRRYFDFDWSSSLGIGVAWQQQQLALSLNLTLWRHL